MFLTKHFSISDLGLAVEKKAENAFDRGLENFNAEENTCLDGAEDAYEEAMQDVQNAFDDYDDLTDEMENFAKIERPAIALSVGLAGGGILAKNKGLIVAGSVLMGVYLIACNVMGYLIRTTVADVETANEVFGYETGRKDFKKAASLDRAKYEGRPSDGMETIEEN